MAAVLGEPLCAESSDNAADATLASTRVDVSFIAGRPAPLAEVFSLVEQQTGWKFAYAVGQLPLGSEMVVKSGGTMPLAQLLADISTRYDILFQLREGRLNAWSKHSDSHRPEPGPVRAVGDERPAWATASRLATPAIVSTSAMALAAEVHEIAEDPTISGAVKEKRISFAVRTAVAAAIVDLNDPGEALRVAQDLAETAASAIPRFVETIANAASFTPAVARISRGQAKVRAAAYAGSRNPKK